MAVVLLARLGDEVLAADVLLAFGLLAVRRELRQSENRFVDRAPHTPSFGRTGDGSCGAPVARTKPRGYAR